MKKQEEKKALFLASTCPCRAKVRVGLSCRLSLLPLGAEERAHATDDLLGAEAIKVNISGGKLKPKFSQVLCLDLVSCALE